MVSNIFYFHPYLGKIPILTNIFQRGWNHQPDKHVFPKKMALFDMSEIYVSHRFPASFQEKVCSEDVHRLGEVVISLKGKVAFTVGVTWTVVPWVHPGWVRFFFWGMKYYSVNLGSILSCYNHKISGYIRDEILPSDIGIKSYYRDPY